MSPIPPFLLQTSDNPQGLSASLFDGFIGCIILIITDSFGNGYAAYWAGQGSALTAGRVGQGVVTVLAVALAASAAAVRPWLCR